MEEADPFTALLASRCAWVKLSTSVGQDSVGTHPLHSPQKLSFGFCCARVAVVCTCVPSPTALGVVTCLAKSTASLGDAPTSHCCPEFNARVKQPQETNNTAAIPVLLLLQRPAYSPACREEAPPRHRRQ